MTRSSASTRSRGLTDRPLRADGFAARCGASSCTLRVIVSRQGQQPDDWRDRRGRSHVGVRADARHGLRLRWRSPGFAAIAIVTLALGIGAKTAMFAAVNGVLLKRLPFEDPDRLMLVQLLVPNRDVPGTYRENVWSYPKYRTFLDAQQVFEDTALFSGRDLDIAGDGEPERIRGEIVSDRYPDILGIEPILGRTYSGRADHLVSLPPLLLYSCESLLPSLLWDGGQHEKQNRSAWKGKRAKVWPFPFRLRFSAVC